MSVKFPWCRHMRPQGRRRNLQRLRTHRDSDSIVEVLAEGHIVICSDGWPILPCRGQRNLLLVQWTSHDRCLLEETPDWRPISQFRDPHVRPLDKTCENWRQWQSGNSSYRQLGDYREQLGEPSIRNCTKRLKPWCILVSSRVICFFSN